MKRDWRRELPLHLMILPGFAIVLLFSYGPLAGSVIAFQDFIPSLGFFGDQEWVGWENFSYALELPDTARAVRNTFVIAGMKIILGIVTPVVFALLLNEVRQKLIKRGIQTVIYLPHFLSWVVLSGILIDILSPGFGVVNKALNALGLESIYFLGSNTWFPITVVVSDTWKEFGFGSIVFMAAISSIDYSLYEASTIDGASWWKQMVHITLPGILPMVILVTVLTMGNILNANFEQIYNLYSPQVYESGDIIDTLVYRIGVMDAQYSVATAIGLMKSIVSLIFVAGTYFAAYRLVGYRIF